jgi:AcrR family transcriptional regulator
MESRRSYRSPVRAAQAETTRARIVEAAFTLLRTTRPIDLSYADIAKKARVALRTVYRVFPTPDDLFLAVSQRFLPDLEHKAQSVAGLIELLESQFEMLEAEPALFRVMFAVPTRSRIDQPSLFGRLFAEQMAHLSPADRRAAFAVVDLLGSPYAWDVMHRNWGLSTARSIRAVVVAVQALFDYLAREPTALSSKSAPPPLARPRR